MEPLRIKDWRALQAKGVTLEKLKAGEFDAVCEFAGYVMARDGKGSVDDLTMTQMTKVVQDTLAAEDVDRPTSASSMP